VIDRPSITQAEESTPEKVIHSDRFLQKLMRRQLTLSVFCAATFMIALFALPLLNYFYPEKMNQRVGGFTLSWLLLGVLFFLLVWVIAFVFIQSSIALEEQEVGAIEDMKRALVPNLFARKKKGELMRWGDEENE
jgi:uncharacterized membrane protein (DUF485 family)